MEASLSFSIPLESERQSTGRRLHRVSFYELQSCSALLSDLAVHADLLSAVHMSIIKGNAGQ